jgi:hypothetical protein
VLCITRAHQQAETLTITNLFFFPATCTFHLVFCFAVHLIMRGLSILGTLAVTLAALGVSAENNLALRTHTLYVPYVGA